MNLGEFRSAVNRRTSIAVDPAALTDIVNEAVQQVGEERDWPWQDGLDTITTTSSASYPMPADWARVRTVTVAGQPTRRINVADGDAYGYSTDRSTQYTYAVESGALVLYPTPPVGTTVLHRYVREETVMNSDADAPLIPARFDGAVVNAAAAIVCEIKGDKRADAFRAEYRSWIKRMNDATSRSQQPSRVRIRRGAAW